jgi:hypothetical protein
MPVLIATGELMFVSRPDAIPVPFCSTIIVAGGGGGFEWSTYEREDSPKPGRENRKAAADPSKERAVTLVRRKAKTGDRMTPRS